MKRVKRCNSESGFASAQFVGLMALSIMVLATLVNIFIIEYMRNASLASVRDAARAGTRVVDLSRVYGTADESVAIEACESRLRESLSDLFNAKNNYEVTCEVLVDESNVDGEGIRYSMKATVSPPSLFVVPWARAFGGRLKNVSATFEQKQVANKDSTDDLVDEEDNDNCVEGEDCTPPTVPTSTTTTTVVPTTTTTTTPITTTTSIWVSP